MGLQKIYEEVSVDLIFDSITKRVYPKLVVWKGKTYKVKKIGLHHTYKEGNVLYHVFSVTTDSSFLRLVLNTKNLHWALTEIYAND